MNIEQEIRCNVCKNKMQYLNHELTVIPYIIDGSPIGVNTIMNVCNIQFYCADCRANWSKPYPYIDKNLVPKFVDDIQKHTVKFDKHEYLELRNEITQ